jgi:oligosaccharide repeat unit polymerase
MLELLIFVTFLGLVLACQRRLGLANPFQIYFFLWLLVFLGYYSYQGSFAVISSEVLMMLLGAKCLALLLLIAALTATTKNHRANFVPIDVRDNRIIAAAQIVVCIAMPFVYMKALSLSDGNDVFSVLGYVRLRTSITEDGIGFGVFAYFFILSYAITSIVVILYATKRISVYWLIFSVAISIFYAYLGTARTAFLLFLLLVLIPLILMRFLKLKGIAFSALLTVAIFIFVAGMTAKGISVDSNLAENVETFSSNIRSYTVAPLLALSQFAGSNFPVDLGKNSFRTVIASAIGVAASIAD